MKPGPVLLNRVADKEWWQGGSGIPAARAAADMSWAVKGNATEMCCCRSIEMSEVKMVWWSRQPLAASLCILDYTGSSKGKERIQINVWMLNTTGWRTVYKGTNIPFSYCVPCCGQWWSHLFKKMHEIFSLPGLMVRLTCFKVLHLWQRLATHFSWCPTCYWFITAVMAALFIQMLLQLQNTNSRNVQQRCNT